jgi:iron(III) transport system substrate-binding protein
MMPTILLAIAAALAAFNAAAQMDPAIVEKAKREGSVTLYTSMQVVDSRPLSEAFEKKHGIKVNLWRASGEKVAQRLIQEARAGRNEVDVVETDGAQVEILHREKQLAPFDVPSIRDVPPEVLPAHRGYVPSRLTLYVLAYNTRNVAAADVPKTYEELLAPRWAGRFAIESDDVAWFAAVVKAMGEAKGLDYFHRLAAMKPTLRSGHTLMVELVAAGDIDLALDAHVQGVARLIEKGAPIAWKPLQPAFGQPSSVGLARRAPHPNAALLFIDFLLSQEGQTILRDHKRVPVSRTVDSPLNKFDYRLIDPAITLDEWDKWSKLWAGMFLGGKAPGKGE